MKKIYTTPTINVYNVNVRSMMAVSMQATADSSTDPFIDFGDDTDEEDLDFMD